MMEDIFSEELVDAPDDIERVIEGGVDEIQGGSGRESGNEETKNDNDKDKDKVKVKRKLGPRPTLNAARLKGPRGIGILETFFSKTRLKGKRHEKEDLELVMLKLEHWAHRLFPRMKFEEALKKIEKLGSKKEVANYVKRIRLGMEDDDVTGVVDDPHDDSPDDPPEEPPMVEDVFDQLMVPPPQPKVIELTDEQRERMLQSRVLAEERRKARLARAKELKEQFLAKQAQSENKDSQSSVTEPNTTNQEPEVKVNGPQECEMEVDENKIVQNGLEHGSKKVDNSSTKGGIEEDMQMERIENDDSSVTRGDDKEQELSMEGIENYHDIAVESSNIQENGNNPDIVRSNCDQIQSGRELDENRPDVL